MPPAIGLKGRVYWRPNRIKPGIEPLYASDADVIGLSSCFLDWDDFPLEHQWDLIQSMALPPSAIVWTGNKSLHPYWILKNSMPASPDAIATWQRVQRGFIQVWKGDHTIKNPSRMMAFPWRPHKNGVMPMVWLPEQPRRYSLAALDEAYGVAEPPS